MFSISEIQVQPKSSPNEEKRKEGWKEGTRVFAYQPLPIYQPDLLIKRIHSAVLFYKVTKQALLGLHD